MRHPKNSFTGKSTSSGRKVGPAPESLHALRMFAAQLPKTQLRATFHDGYVRTLASEGERFLWTKPLQKPVQLHARDFVENPAMSEMLGIGSGELAEDAIVTELPWCDHRVQFKQQITTAEGVKVPVLRGFVEVVVRNDGKVLTLNSTARHAKNSDQLSVKDLRSEKDAIKAATTFLKAKWGVTNIEMTQARLVFSEHRKRFSPVYQVIVAARSPRCSFEVLVRATDCDVLNVRNMVKHLKLTGKKKPRSLRAIKRAISRAVPSNRFVAEGGNEIIINTDSDGGAHLAAAKGKGKGKSKGNTSGSNKVQANALLRVPDPNIAIDKQVHRVLLESLTDPKKLANSNYVCYVGNKRNPVPAMKDGTFNYVPNNPEFSAVATMFALTIHLDLFKKWGMPAPKQAVKLYVEDQTIVDNAQFDQVTVEIRIGVGSGLNNGGLTRYVAYDIGVSLHENGHYIVYLTAPGQDLPGVEGAAIHEAVGDAMTLLIDFWFRSKFAKSLGVQLTVADVVASARIIGAYAAPPSGIRQQKNTSRPPLSGEPHDDSLIVGGAMADLMVELVQQHGIDPGLEMFGRLLIAALCIVPSHKVTFRDLLNAFLTADTQLNQGANKPVIVKTFNAHGITLSGGKKRRSGGAPVIIVVN